MTWLLALKVACAPVSDAVIECRTIVMKHSATSPEWDAVVVPKVLNLVNTTLPVFSDGFADGLLFFWVG